MTTLQMHPANTEKFDRDNSFQSEVIVHAGEITEREQLYPTSRSSRYWRLTGPKGNVVIWDSGNHWYDIEKVNMSPEDTKEFWNRMEQYFSKHRDRHIMN